MQFIDLKKQYSQIKEKVNQRIDNVLEHGQYVMGPEVFELETRLAQFVGTKHCVSCSSGTDALLIPLMSMDIGPGDAVITTPFTFIATAEVIKLVGATPVFVDIDPATFNIRPDLVEQAALEILESRHLTLKAVIPVDLFGLPCDYPALETVCEKYNLRLIEDAAQGLGGSLGKRMACSFGDVSATSFFPAKPLGCYGDGGAVFTDNSDLYDVMTSVRIHGQGTNKYDNIRIGINGRMDTIQAAILLEKLNIFPEEIKSRNSVAQMYNHYLQGKVVVPNIFDNSVSAWAQYTILCEDSHHRSSIQEKLRNNGIPPAIYYIKPIHMQEAFADLNYKSGDFPVAEDFSSRVLSLPMHPYLKEEDIKHISDII